MNIFSEVSGDMDRSRVYHPHEHSIVRQNVSEGATRVLFELLGAGYEAYLVGGGVRDLLLKQSPSDFDIATNATPSEISQIFRKSRIIGRRFKLVHVKMKSEIVEVATFRKNPGSRDHLNRRGIIFRDNDFGSIEEDAVRRDFTVNALYLNIKSMTIHDYVGGMHDIKTKTLRLIGDPKVRFHEDPVRILRAVRFSDTFGFRLVGFSKMQLQEYGPQLCHIPSARLFGEISKLFLRGSAAGTFYSLRSVKLLQHLLPLTERVLSEKKTYVAERFINLALSNTDQRVKEGGTVTVAFLIAVFLWESLVKEKERQHKLGIKRRDAVDSAEQLVLSRQLEKVTIPRRTTKAIREIWQLQYIFSNPSVRRAEKILRHPRLRAAYNFFSLRAESGEDLSKPLNWWADFFSESMSLHKLPFPESSSYNLKKT